MSECVAELRWGETPAKPVGNRAKRDQSSAGASLHRFDSELQFCWSPDIGLAVKRVGSRMERRSKYDSFNIFFSDHDDFRGGSD